MNIKRYLQPVVITLLAGVMVFGSSNVLAAKGSTVKTKKLSGKVLDSANKPLSGVSVVATPVANPAGVTTNTKKQNYSLTFAVGTTYNLTYTKSGYVVNSPTPIPPLVVTSSTKSIPDVRMSLISPTLLEVSQVDANTTSLRWQYIGERTGVFFTIERKRTSVIPAVTGGFSTTPAVPAETDFSRLDSKEYALSYYDDSSKLINGKGLIAGQTYAYRVKAGNSPYSNEATVTITRTNDGQWHDFAGATGSGTCTDSIKNGDETGIDTGGRCGTTVVTPPPANDGTVAVGGTVTMVNNVSFPVNSKLYLTSVSDQTYSCVSDISSTGSFATNCKTNNSYLPSVVVVDNNNQVSKQYLPSGWYDLVYIENSGITWNSTNFQPL